MGILSWLRSFVADLFHAGSDEPSANARRAEAELEELRNLTLLAVAQARRTAFELRETMAESEPDRARLTHLVPVLEEERARAETMLERYREREKTEADRLKRLGELRAAEALNQRRARLRDEVLHATESLGEHELARMEDEARGEAYRLDVLGALEAAVPPPAASGGAEDLMSRARRLLDQPAIGGIRRE